MSKEEFSGGAYFPNTITMNGVAYIKEEELVNSEKAADAHIEKLEKEIKELKKKLEEVEKERDMFECEARGVNF